MAIVKRSNKEIHEGTGRIDEAGFAALTDDDVERFIREDDSDTARMGEPRYVPPRVDVRALRRRLGLSQTAFARRFLLPLRSIQQWEQEQREPSEAARVLLFAIDNDPNAVEHALHKKKAS